MTRPAQSDALVFFGATGDLAKKQIFPALYGMVEHGELTIPVIGVAFSQWTLADLEKRATESDQGGEARRQGSNTQAAALPAQVR